MTNINGIDDIVTKYTGMGNIDVALAYEYLTKGYGEYDLPQEHILQSFGYKKIIVRPFKTWQYNSEYKEYSGYTDVVFSKCDGLCSSTHFEFHINLSGHGGACNILHDEIIKENNND